MNAATEGVDDVGALPSASAGQPGSSGPGGTPTAQAVAATDAAGAAGWLDIELADARSGETFTLASLAGGVVAIEPMAIWCTNCKAQQDRVKEVYDDIEASGATYISLGVDPGETAPDLARYADRRGYEWTFVQSSTKLSRALRDVLGAQVLSPPSTPLIVLDPTGEVVVLEFGSHDPPSLLAILAEAA
jgi:hypothetical protein